MLKINRLKIEIIATNRTYQFDEIFNTGRNPGQHRG